MTEKDLEIQELRRKLKDYTDTGITAAEVAEVRFLIAAERDPKKLARLRDMVIADEEGRLVVLPCKVGDTVYQTDGIRIYESVIKRLVFDGNNIAFDESAIGASIFLTREEAEKALKEVM